MLETLFYIIVGVTVFSYFFSKKTTAKTYSNTNNDKIEVKEKRVKTKVLDDQNENVYSMFFNVVGESFKNDDGSSRQEIIEKWARPGDPAHLKFYNYKGSLACGVYLDDKFVRQIGHIGKDEVQELYEVVTAGDTIEPRIHTVGTGKKGLYGVTIEILIEDE